MPIELCNAEYRYTVLDLAGLQRSIRCQRPKGHTVATGGDHHPLHLWSDRSDIPTFLCVGQLTRQMTAEWHDDECTKAL